MKVLEKKVKRKMKKKNKKLVLAVVLGIFILNFTTQTANAWVPEIPPVEESFALIVAINDYENVDDLSSPVYHANRWYNLLVNHQGYNPSHITMLLNSAATESNIEDALDEIGSKSGNQINLIFIGHGEVDFGKYFFAGWDTNDKWWYTHKVTSEEIYDSIKDADVDEIYLHFASCYSGELINDLKEKSWDQKVLIHTAETYDAKAIEYPFSGVGYRQLFEYRFLEWTFNDHFHNTIGIDLSSVFTYMKTYWPTTNPWYKDEPQTWDNLDSTEKMYLF